MSETVEPLIVVGVDGSNHSKEALRWAVGQAKATGSRVHAVMSWQWNTNPFAVGTAEQAELMSAEEGRGSGWRTPSPRRSAPRRASRSSAASNRAPRPRCWWRPPGRRN